MTAVNGAHPLAVLAPAIERVMGYEDVEAALTVMAGNYFILSCEDPDDGYLARISYTSDDPRRSWILGERFSAPPPTPVQAVVRGMEDDDTVIAELWKAPLPAMTKRLHAALAAAGVANLDVFPLSLKNATTGEAYDSHVAFNLIGTDSALDLRNAPVPAAGTNERLVADSLDGLVIDERRTGGLLMFRLAESVSTIVIHAAVRARLEAAGIDTLTFHEAADWERF